MAWDHLNLVYQHHQDPPTMKSLLSCVLRAKLALKLKEGQDSDSSARIVATSTTRLLIQLGCQGCWHKTAANSSKVTASREDIILRLIFPRS